MSQNSPACRTCRFFHPEISLDLVDGLGEGSGHGECRIKAPQILQDAEGHRGLRIWPGVFEQDWCGEYQADDV